MVKSQSISEQATRSFLYNFIPPFYDIFNPALDIIPKMEREANSLALKILISMQDMTEIQGLTKYQLLNYLGLPFKLKFF
ncbi:hypothetical protein CRI87_08995 [Liquorilactobacillus satsumensis]|nr:hypothetical protein [Liquorilactobacillus satsumensis]